MGKRTPSEIKFGVSGSISKQATDGVRGTGHVRDGDKDPLEFLDRRDLLELVPVAAYSCSLDGSIISFNSEAARLWGRAPKLCDPHQRYCGSTRLYRPSGESLPHDRTPMAECLKTGRSCNGEEVVVERPDGSRATVRVKINPICDDEGIPVGAINFFYDVTETRRAERRLDAVLDSIGDHLATYDNEWRYTYLNDKAAEVLGRPKEELLGHSIWEMFPNAVGNQYYQDLHEAKSTGKVVRSEHYYAPLSTWFENHIYPSAEGVTVFSSDISHRKGLEKALRSSEARFEQVILLLPAAVYTTDVEGRITLYNKHAEDMWGRAPRLNEDMWCGSLKIYYPDGRPMALEECPMAIALRTGEPCYGREIIVERPDGTRRWVQPHPQPLRDASGELVGALNMLVDITERKRIEEALRVEKQSLEIVNRTGSHLASKLDLDELVQDLTEAATELVGAQFGSFFYNVVNDTGESYMLYTIAGVPREKFSNFPMPRATELFGPTFRGEGIVRIADVKQDPRYGKMAPHYGMPKGHLPVASYLAAPVISRSGEVLGGLFFGHADTGVFTERHEGLLEGIAAQAAIAIDNARLYTRVRLMNEELERRVEDRTAQLKAANEEMQGFTYTVSHDLRSPLRAIVSTSRILYEDFGEGLPPEAVHLLDRQATSAARLATLIDNLLEYSRLARYNVRKQEVNLADLARQAVENHGPLEGARADVRIPGSLDAQGDPGLLALVFENLIGNAFKFTEPGAPIHIEVGTEEVEGERRFFVRDEGIGFNMAFAPKLFLPFERLHRDDEYSGTGIGLANVKRIIEKHGGRVWGESEGPGKGATFYFTLPE